MDLKELVAKFNITTFVNHNEMNGDQTILFKSQDGLFGCCRTISLDDRSKYFGNGLEQVIVDEIAPLFEEYESKKMTPVNSSMAGFIKGLGAEPPSYLEAILSKVGSGDGFFYMPKFNGRSQAKRQIQMYKEMHMFDNITIIKSPNADSRSGNENFSLETLSEATDRHIMDVQRGLALFANFLNLAGDNHDFTKKAYMEEFYADCIRLNFGDQFKNGRWYQMHIVRERHHLLSKAPDDVNLIDVLEYLTDGVMAGMARSLDVYDMALPDELLQKAYKNTVELLKSRVKVVEEK